MKRDLSWFSIYVKGNFHVSFSALSLSSLSMKWLNISPPFVVYFFLFLGTLFGYNFLKYYSVRHKLIKSPYFLRKLAVSSFIVGSVAIFISLSRFRLGSIVIAVFSTFITLFYAKGSPVVFSRENGFLKTILVSLVWALMCVSFPATYYGTHLLFEKEVIQVFFAVFFLVLALMVPFEIRDLTSDNLYWPTLAQYLGTTKIKLLGMVFLVVAMVLFSTTSSGEFSNYSAMGTMCILVSLAILKSHKKQSQWFASFWVEAIPIAALTMYCLFQ